MTDDPRVEAVARAICLSRPAPACDCRDRCRAITEALEIHYPQARAALAAADAARPLPADVAGLVERLNAPIGYGGYNSEDSYEKYDDLRLEAAAALTALAAPAPAADAAAVRKAAVEQAAKAAADFVHHRLYRGGGDRAFPVCSFHSRDIYEHVLALADAPGGDDGMR